MKNALYWWCHIDLRSRNQSLNNDFLLFSLSLDFGWFNNSTVLVSGYVCNLVASQRLNLLSRGLSVSPSAFFCVCNACNVGTPDPNLVPSFPDCHPSELGACYNHSPRQPAQIILPPYWFQPLFPPWIRVGHIHALNRTEADVVADPPPDRVI